MSYTIISVENLSKTYRLGQIGTGTLTNDLKTWWAKKRGLPNPLLKIGQVDQDNNDGETLWALKDVSFTVQQGEVLGIIGRNGAGKSTLLKVLSRVTAPTSGQVKVKGRIASLLEVGTGFHPDLTARENIYLNGAILGMSKKEVGRKFDEIVAFAEVEKFIDTAVKRFSSGMYVRLAFAVAAHLESEILLVDEVLAVGDAEFQKKCLGKMGDIANNEGRTVLFVSHNMGSVKSICNLGIILDKGQTRGKDDINSIIYKYLDQLKTQENQIKIFNSQYNIFKLFSIEIADKNGKCRDSFFLDEEIWIKIQFQIEDNFQKINPVLNIVDQFENIIISSSNFNEDFWYFEKQEKGVYQSTCKIPANLLNNQEYFIDIFFVENLKTRISSMSHKIKLSLIDSGKYRDIFGGNWSGIVRPYFEWETKRIS